MAHGESPDLPRVLVPAGDVVFEAGARGGVRGEPFVYRWLAIAKSEAQLWPVRSSP